MSTGVFPTHPIKKQGGFRPEVSEKDQVKRERRRWWRGLRFGGELLARRAGEREAAILAIICALDMYTTLWWVTTGQAVEANPLLAWSFRYHPVFFVLLKCATFLPALALVTRLGAKRPEFTRWVLRYATLLYIGIYLVGVK